MKSSETDRINLIGTMVDNITMKEAVSIIESFIREKKHRMVFTPNVDHLVKLQKDVEFRYAYEKCDLALPDSRILFFASRFLGTPLKEQVPGSVLLPRFCEIAAERGYRIFLLGGGPGIAQMAAANLRKKHPSLQIVGTCCPPFGFENSEREIQKIVELIREARADVLFVGLGAPKQEKFILKYKEQYNCPVSIGVGAGLDFAAGHLKRAPALVSQLGFEWLWRLLQEPRRLWRRYLMEDPKFFYWFLLQKLGKLKS